MSVEEERNLSGAILRHFQIYPEPIYEFGDIALFLKSASTITENLNVRKNLLGAKLSRGSSAGMRPQALSNLVPMDTKPTNKRQLGPIGLKLPMISAPLINLSA